MNHQSVPACQTTGHATAHAVSRYRDTQFLPAILTQGLLPGARAHGHLAQHPQTAAVVGQRCRSGVVLTIHALRMYDQGFEFYQEENGFWLTARVPAGFIR